MKQFKLLLLLSLGLIAFSCDKEIVIADYIDLNKSLRLTITHHGQIAVPANIIEIKPNSKEYNTFIEWANKHEAGWSSTPASYLPEVCISQNEFQLFYFPKTAGVVINFKDKDGKFKQYRNTTDKGDLDFLTNN